MFAFGIFNWLIDTQHASALLFFWFLFSVRSDIWNINLCCECNLKFLCCACIHTMFERIRALTVYFSKKKIYDLRSYSAGGLAIIIFVNILNLIKLW